MFGTLVAMSLAVRSFVALVLLLCFPLVVVAIAVGVIAVGVLMGDGVPTPLRQIPIVAGVSSLLTLAAAVVRAVRKRPQLPEGPELARADAPALWELVDDLTTRMDVRRPDRIVVVAETNALVAELRGERTMFIGLPLLAAMTRTELSAVLAHELGHYAHGHTRLTARTYRWSVLTGEVLNRIDNSLIHRTLSVYYRKYLLVARSVNRAHELQADDWAARLTAPRAAASAWRRLEDLERCWGALTREYLPYAGDAARRGSLSTGLVELLRARPEGPPDAPRPVSALDTHPPTPERVARLLAMAWAEDAGSDDAPVDPVPARTLLAEGSTTLDELEHRLSGDDDPPADWAEIVRLGGHAEAERIAGRAAEVLPDPTVGDLLDTFADDRRDEVVAPLVTGGRTQDPDDDELAAVGTAVLAAAVHLALAGSGRARHALSWTDSRRWELSTEEDGWEDVDLFDLVAPAAQDPACAAELIELLEDWGADLDLPLKRVAPPTTTPAWAGWGQLQLTGPLIPGGPRHRGAWGVVDLVVFATGVLLVRPGFFWAVGDRDYRRQAADRYRKIVEAAQGRPAEYASTHPPKNGKPAARWIPATEILDVEYVKRIVLPSRLRFTLASGETLVLRTASFTTPFDDPLDRLVELAAPC